MLKIRVMPTLLHKEFGLDITATQEGRRPDFQLVDDFADDCFMPLTVGGGIKTVEDVHELIGRGADKVAINTTAVETPELLTQVARRFGAQCVVASIDFKKTAAGWEVMIRAGAQPTGLDPVAHAMACESRGAGEILLTSVDRDGTMTGYDLELTRRVSEAVSIPVIASGGAGGYEHMGQALKEGKASAVAAAAIFHYTEHPPLEAKRYLHQQGFPIRL